MKKILSILIIMLSTYFTPTTNNYFGEESSPIREADKIVGMNYTITIDDSVKNKYLDIDTSIISSIKHYKDINFIDDFYVDLKIDNKSKYKYSIKDISLISNGDYNKYNIDYKNKNKYVVIKLNKDDFKDNYFIQIKLKK